MKLKVIGSSGAHPFPNPGCSCIDCRKAKMHGIPYERISSSLFVYPDILIDTPEEVFRRFIEFDIKRLNHVFYTHWHPDHTQGMRLFELWVDSGFIGKMRQRNPINVYLPTDMVVDFDHYLPTFRGYESMNHIHVIEVEDRTPLRLGTLTITPVNLNRPDRVRYAFLIEEPGKRVIYAPCSIFQTQMDQFWNNLDLLFIETGWQGNTAQLRKEQAEDWLVDHISLEESLEFIEHVNPKKAVFTHLEGAIHQTYDLIKKAVETHPHVEVAYDGLEIEL